MQYMYLRRKGNKKNPGRHPIGLLGVQKLENGSVAIAVQMIHSKDRFEKKMGRQLLERKINKINGIKSLLTNKEDIPSIHSLLPSGVSDRLDGYPRHQEILERLVQDEFDQGSWSKTQTK